MNKGGTMTRKEIENEWLKQSERLNQGPSLCAFLRCTPYKRKWAKIWKTSERCFISGFYIHNYYNEEKITDSIEMTYLCRALSLNMLLDDSKVK